MTDLEASTSLDATQDKKLDIPQYESTEEVQSDKEIYTMYCGCMGRCMKCFLYCTTIALYHFACFVCVTLFPAMILKFEYYWQIALVAGFVQWIASDTIVVRVARVNNPNFMYWDIPLVAYMENMVTPIVCVVVYMIPFWISKENPNFVCQIYILSIGHILCWFHLYLDASLELDKEQIIRYAYTSSNIGSTFCNTNKDKIQEIRQKLKETFPNILCRY